MADPQKIGPNSVDIYTHSNRAEVISTMRIIACACALGDVMFLLIGILHDPHTLGQSSTILLLLLFFPILPLLLSCMLVLSIATYRVTSEGIEYSPSLRAKRFLKWQEVQRIRLLPRRALFAANSGTSITLPQTRRGELWAQVTKHLDKHFDLRPLDPRSLSILPSRIAYPVVAIVVAVMLACAWRIQRYPYSRLAAISFVVVPLSFTLLVYVYLLVLRISRRLEVWRNRVA